MELKNLTINFLGDSITEGYGTTATSNVFHQIIKEKYSLKYAYNYGLSGTRIARQNVPTKESTKYDLTFELRSEIMDRSADAIVVFGGTNDYGHGDAKLGTFDDRDDYTFYGALHNLVAYMVSTFPKDKLCFILPIPRFDQDNPYGDGGKENPIAPMSAYINAEKEVLAYYGVEYLDLSDKFPLPTTTQDDGGLYADGLHPNPKGHQLLADCLIAYLKNVGYSKE